MSGFDLLAPAGLLALIAIPLVVLFHMRHTTPVVRDVPSLRFWRQATREETHEERFKRPPINLLFLLHILLVAAIAFALTRPAVSSALGGLGSRTEPRHVILLLDGSTSMAARDTASGETRFAEAAKVADERLAALQNGDVATVVLMGTHSTTLAANDPEGIRAVRERLATTPLPGGRVDLDDALTLVKDLLLPSMRDEIVVVTDGALAADPSVVSEIGAAIELVVRVGGDIADNVAITDIATRGSPSNPGEQQLYARLVNFGAAAISAPVVILADGIELSRADVTVPPAGGVQEITQTLPEGAATVTVRLELTDALADDNIASSVLVQGEEFGLRILLVSDIPTALQRALAVLPGSEITLRSPVEAAAARDLGSFDLVVYEHELPATRFPDAPVLIVDPPEAGLLPTRGVMANPTAIRIRAQDPLLTGVEVAGVTFGQAPVIVLDGGSTEIVGAESGPLIFRGTTPDSDQPMIVLAFDVAESNLPQRVAFPILVANIANELAPSPLPASAPLGEPIIYRPHGAAASIRITNPAGEQIDLPLVTAESETTFDAVREIAFADTGTVGEYRVEELDTAGNVLAGGRFIVNAGHVRESDLTPNADLGNILAGSDAGADGGSGESLSDLWPVLVAAAFALLLIEWIRHYFRAGVAVRWRHAPWAQRRLLRITMLDITFARSEALYLLLLVPIAGFLGWWFGVKRGRFPRSVNLLRMAIIALLALTLAQPLTTSGGDARTTVFVVDQSNSLTAGSGTDVEAWIDEAIREEGDGNRAAVVAFGSAPVLAQPPTAAEDIGDWGEGLTIDAEYTDVESALALARALPVGGARRIVLVSDGAENLGTALNQVGQAASDGTPIDVLPLPGIAGDDLRVDGVTAPAAVWSGETINVLTSIGTAEGGSGSIELVVDGAVVSTQAATFQPGLNTFTFPVQDLEPGFHAFEVRVQSADAPDAYADNNVAPFAVVVRDAPKLLLVSPEGSDPGRLQGALERRGAIVTRSLPKDVSSRLSDLGVYDAFVLNNVPAQSLSFDQLTGLQEATRSLGKGLVVIGGTQSYGPGSYAGTILEETLPVTVRVTDGRERQRVALLLIMDKSGSMSYDPLGGSSKIEMAKEAARAAVAALADGDQVGILTFNDTQQWVVQMTLLDGAETRNAINAAIDTITADGGTEIYPALQAGFDAIRLSEADVRHVVLLSDGKSRTGTPESYQALIADTISDRTTLSAIAIGDDSDTVLLDNLANWGNGRYHFADRPEMIPQLTLQEAQSAGSQSVIRGQFTMLQTLPSPILLGFAPEDLPALEGYDYAEAKPGAQVILTSQRDDPILAKWQFGLGRVVAWTGDDGADFALPWTEWSRFDEFWASMIRWTLPDPENRALNVTVERDGPEAVVSVTSVGQSGDYVDSASTTATITGPDGAVTADIPLFQSGPGEYQLRIAAPQPGAYRIDLVQQRTDGEVTEVAGFSMPPSPELQPAPGGGALMQTIAARTGGRVLTLDDPGAAFSSEGLSGTALQTYNARWFVPLALALMLLLLELAIRLQFFSRVRAAFGRT